MNNKVYTIDAEGKALGRLASEIAKILQGKHKTSFVPNQNRGDKVKILNASKVKITGKKLEQKKYYTHSGYAGHLKAVLLKDAFKNPEFVIRKTVKGMLPKNKLLKERMKNLMVVK